MDISRMFNLFCVPANKMLSFPLIKKLQYNNLNILNYEICILDRQGQNILYAEIVSNKILFASKNNHSA